jgi:hypothetical protein
LTQGFWVKTGNGHETEAVITEKNHAESEDDPAVLLFSQTFNPGPLTLSLSTKKKRPSKRSFLITGY